MTSHYLRRGTRNLDELRAAVLEYAVKSPAAEPGRKDPSPTADDADGGAATRRTAADAETTEP